MEQEMEVWRPIPDFEGYYEISNMGFVKRLKRVQEFKSGVFRTLKERISRGKRSNGYLCVELCKPGYRLPVRVHVLVGREFIPNPENKPHINHKKGIKTDNRASELEWTTPAENTKHARDTGLAPSVFGEGNPMCKLTTGVVVQIFKSEQPFSEIADEFKTTVHNVRNIKNGISWGHVTGKKRTRGGRGNASAYNKSPKIAPVRS